MVYSVVCALNIYPLEVRSRPARRRFLSHWVSYAFIWARSLRLRLGGGACVAWSGGGGVCARVSRTGGSDH
eukprot:scaffold2693_cov139-Isochrysis_galbana.AAC.5